MRSPSSSRLPCFSSVSPQSLHPHPELSWILHEYLQIRGQQWRPRLGLRVAAMLGGRDAVAKVMPAALAVELVHGYSLIHDDLPAMDDSSERRGHPTLHVRYNEASAILAGDALLSDAFEVCSTWPGDVTNRARVLWVQKLAQLIGSRGMVGGQYDDVHGNKGRDNLRVGVGDAAFFERMYDLKSGALCGAMLAMAAVGADQKKRRDLDEEPPKVHEQVVIGPEASSLVAKNSKVRGAPQSLAANLERAGILLGRAYQIQDDIHDLAQQSSGDGEGPKTLVAAVGLEESLQRYHQARSGAVAMVQVLSDHQETLTLINKVWCLNDVGL